MRSLARGVADRPDKADSDKGEGPNGEVGSSDILTPFGVPVSATFDTTAADSYPEWSDRPLR